MPVPGFPVLHLHGVLPHVFSTEACLGCSATAFALYLAAFVSGKFNSVSPLPPYASFNANALIGVQRYIRSYIHKLLISLGSKYFERFLDADGHP